MIFKDTILKSIKEGMKAEMDSVMLYTNAAENTTDSDVKKFFRDRADEEIRHYNFLLAYYTMINNDKEPIVIWDKGPKPATEISPAINREFIERIGESQVLFSAISTALLLEKSGIDFYDKCRDETTVLVLKEFFQMLRDWEQAHYRELIDIQREAEIVYWERNDFQPF